MDPVPVTESELQNPSQSLSFPPPQPVVEHHQPPLKKPKMSSTATSDDETTTPSKPLRLKRRKVAIFFAYCGVGYQGMQKNPGAKTIEGDLEEALFFAGAVPEADRGQSKRFDWARSARTDKGVSAVGQVVSGRFYVDPPGFVERLSSHLPPQIRIFGYKRVTPSFNAKKFCDRRRYVYLLPVFALDGSRHRDRESVIASVGSGNELAKCLECSERGRKVLGLMGNRRDWDSMGFVQSGISSNSGDAVALAGENEGEDSDNLVQLGISSSSGDASLISNGKAEVLVQSVVSSNSEAALLNSEVKEAEQANGPVVMEEEERKEQKSEFKYGEEERKMFNRILKHYEGTHNFHNFTTRTKAEDPSAKRYIVSFEANSTLTIEGMEFVKCEVIGQSFMLHQIRKMIGMAVSVMRDFVPESVYERAFDQDFHMNVPTAPEVGLYLDECLFTSYNNKWKDTHQEVSMKDYAEEAEEFKLKYIYSHVAETERKYGSVAVWLHSLNHRNYPDFRCPNDVEVERTAEGEVEGGGDGGMERADDDRGETVADDGEERAADGEVEITANDEGERATDDEVKKTAEGEAMDVLP